MTEPFGPPGRASGPHAPPYVPKPAVAQEHYRFTAGLRAGEVAPIRGDHGQIVLSYRAFASVVAVIAALVTIIVALAGAAGTAFLLAEGSELRALAALVLTLQVGLVTWLLTAPRFAVASVEVKGASRVSVERILAAAASEPGTNLWRLDTDAVAVGVGAAGRGLRASDSPS